MSQLVLKYVKEKNWGAINSLLDSNEPPESFASKNQWVLAQACLHNQTEIVAKLLPMKRVVPLHKILCNAVENSAIEIVQTLLETNRIDLTVNNDEALLIAIRAKRFAYADAILAKHPYAVESNLQLVNRFARKDPNLFWIIVQNQEITTYCDKKGWIATFFKLECNKADLYLSEKRPLNYYDFVYRKERNGYAVYSEPKNLEKESSSALKHLHAKITHYTATMMALDDSSFDCQHMVSSLLYFFSRFHIETDFYIKPILDCFNQCWSTQENKHGFFKPNANIQNMLHWNPDSLRCLSDYFLIARGYLVQPEPRQVVLKAKVWQLAKEITWAIEVSLGLRQLDLPVLLLQELFYSAAEPMARCFDQHMVWRIMQTIVTIDI